jgi:purine-cytosine permease-like protein
VAPWLGVVLTDRFLRRCAGDAARLGTMTTRGYTNWAGPVSFVLALVVSVWLFSDQSQYVGPVVKAHPGIGDVTPLVGFALAALGYALLFKPLAHPAPEAAAPLLAR